MKHQLNLLTQLQELVMTRDEHHQTGDGSHTEALMASIDAMLERIEQQPRALWDRLYKKDHIVMSPMSNGCCAVCGMKLPVSQVQQVRLEKTIQTCSSCGRMLYNAEDDAPRYVGGKPARGEPRKTGISRFSAPELMVCSLKGSTAEEAIAELVNVMTANKFVSNPEGLIAAALERENMLSTALGNGLAFPHVRGVEGGGLTLALGLSEKGIEWDTDGNKANIVVFSVIPVAVSVFYMRLISNLCESFAKKENFELVKSAKTQAELWKSLIKATRYAVK